MQRIAIAGTSGSGKSTLARRLSVALDLPYVELDSLYHGPNWTPRPEFVDDVTRFVSQERWVIEWQYGVARPVIAARADTLVWLDYPKRLVMRRVILRTLRRRATKEEIWNGNREAPLRTILTDRDHIVRWSWNTHVDTQPRIDELGRTHPNIDVIRIRSPRELERWLRQLRNEQ